MELIEKRSIAMDIRNTSTHANNPTNSCISKFAHRHCSTTSSSRTIKRHQIYPSFIHCISRDPSTNLYSIRNKFEAAPKVTVFIKTTPQANPLIPVLHVWRNLDGKGEQETFTIFVQWTVDNDLKLEPILNAFPSSLIGTVSPLFTRICTDDQEPDDI